MDYGIRITGKSGSIQYHEKFPFFSLVEYKDVNLTGGSQVISFQSPPIVTAIYASEWVSMKIDFYQNLEIKQPFNGGRSSIKIYSFDTPKERESEDYGLFFRGENGQLNVLDGSKLLKVLHTAMLPHSTTSWSYQAPEGVSIAVMVGGGSHPIRRSHSNIYYIYDMFFRIVGGNRLEIESRPYYSAINLKESTKQSIDLSIVIVDVTTI